MSVLIARHSISDANIEGHLAFGKREARLTQEGRGWAKGLGWCFMSFYDINPAETPAAVSELFRSPETAIEAGFRKLAIYSILNEVASGLSAEEYRAAKQRGKHPSPLVRPRQDYWSLLQVKVFG
jgi:hypothetical protein